MSDSAIEARRAAKREYDRLYRAANPEKCREAKRRWKAANPEKNREYTGRWRESNLESSRQMTRDAQRRLYQANRDAVFDHYGRACACCGATERLSIDHVNGDGKQHREGTFGSNSASGAPTYRWLVKNGFPVGFQTLCMSCNRSKGIGAACQLTHRREVMPDVVAGTGPSGLA